MIGNSPTDTPLGKEVPNHSREVVKMKERIVVEFGHMVSLQEMSVSYHFNL